MQHVVEYIINAEVVGMIILAIGHANKTNPPGNATTTAAPFASQLIGSAVKPHFDAWFGVARPNARTAMPMGGSLTADRRPGSSSK